jgi:hypothetical protein
MKWLVRQVGPGTDVTNAYGSSATPVITGSQDSSPHPSQSEDERTPGRAKK